jgi:signal transduction histidine kinase
MLDDLGLPEAIDWLVKEFSRRTGIDVDTRLGEGLQALPPQLATTLYRIVQEALTNITRHARATRAAISLTLDDHELLLTIQDNGTGFTQGTRTRPPGSFGLLGIRERVLLLGGQLSVGNVPEGGARLVVRVPLTQPDGQTRCGPDPEGESAQPLFEETMPAGIDRGLSP